MKKFTLPVIFVVLAIIGLIGYVLAQGWYNFQSDKRLLFNEISSYYNEKGNAAATLAVNLAHPHLEAKEYADYKTRIQTLDRFDRLLGIEIVPDTYEAVIKELALDDLENWAVRTFGKKTNIYVLGNPSYEIDPNTIEKAVREKTPQPVILAMHQPLQLIGMVRLGFYGDDFNKESLAKAHQEFAESKAKFEKALAQAKKWRG